MMSDITKTIFVIMPFSKANDRREADLTQFYEDIKDYIEEKSTSQTQYRYKVRRSEKHIYIHEKIFEDLFDADIVICDLSGNQPNPNVMFELGLRLSWANKPIILMRDKRNKKIRLFDVDGLHIEYYDSVNYENLKGYLVSEICNIEKSEEWKSPIFKIMEFSPSVLKQIRRKAVINRLKMLLFGVSSYLVAYTNSVATFLQDRIDIAFSENTLIFFDQFVKEMEEFAKLDWEEFKFLNITFPSLEAYITEPSIEEFVPEDVYRKFTTYAVTFYNMVVNSNAVPKGEKFRVVHGSLYECLLLNDMTFSLLRYIQNPEKAQIHYDKFYDSFNRSAFLDYIKDHARFVE